MSTQLAKLGSRQPGMGSSQGRGRQCPPKPACCVHGPSLALSGSKGLWPPYPWWPDPSKRLAPGPGNQLAPKAEATSACAPQSWGEPGRGHSLHDLKDGSSTEHVCRQGLVCRHAGTCVSLCPWVWDTYTFRNVCVCGGLPRWR